MLTAADCQALQALYADSARFRSTVVMEQHAYGLGEYRYFSYPLPARVAELRAGLYACLAGTADRWNRSLGLPAEFPPTLSGYLARCHAVGQTRPTPLLLRYRVGGHNRLHQDLYGDHAFPLQVAVNLSRPGEDYTGGEFVLAEQRPRQQTRVDVLTLAQGEGLVFPNCFRPEAGKHSPRRVRVRHGVSRVHSGERHTLGIIFHDAR